MILQCLAGPLHHVTMVVKKLERPACSPKAAGLLKELFEDVPPHVQDGVFSQVPDKLVRGPLKACNAACGHAARGGSNVRETTGTSFPCILYCVP